MDQISARRIEYGTGHRLDQASPLCLDDSLSGHSPIKRVMSDCPPSARNSDAVTNANDTGSSRMVVDFRRKRRAIIESACAVDIESYFDRR